MRHGGLSIAGRRWHNRGIGEETRMTTGMSTGHIDLAFADRPEGGRIARVTIAHEAKLNTFNPTLMHRFIETMALLARTEDLRGVVLTGAGPKAFIGGADIGAMAAIADGQGAEAFIRLVHGCCAAVRACPVPVIGRINGWTLGAGLELAAACDMRIAATTAHFGMPEVRVGIPSVVEAALLPGLIGWGRTRRLLLLAETIDAATALDWGLVEHVVAPEGLDAAVAEWLDHLCAAGPAAIRNQKALIRQWEDLPLGAAIEAGVAAFARSWDGDEPTRMMRGFLERRRG
jgi:enoyl-CoA hydratase/carnithine racemase